MKFFVISILTLSVANFAFAGGMSKSGAWGSSSEDGSISACRENYNRITDGLAMGCRSKGLSVQFSPCMRIREATPDEVQKYANIQKGFFLFETTATWDCK